MNEAIEKKKPLEATRPYFPSFQNWWEAEYTRLFELDNDVEIHAEPLIEKLAKKLSINNEAFVNQFISPLEGFSQEDWATYQQILTAFIGHLPLIKKYGRPYEFIVRPLEEACYNAMLFQLALMHEYHFSKDKEGNHYNQDSLAYNMFFRPVKQCWVCGKPDQDKRDQDYMGKFCHTDQCTSVSGNYIDHDEQCCGRYWLKWKDYLRVALSRCKTEADVEQTYKNYYLKLLDIIKQRQKYTIRWEEGEKVEVLAHA